MDDDGGDGGRHGEYGGSAWEGEGVEAGMHCEVCGSERLRWTEFGELLCDECGTQSQDVRHLVAEEATDAHERDRVVATLRRRNTRKGRGGHAALAATAVPSAAVMTSVDVLRGFQYILLLQAHAVAMVVTGGGGGMQGGTLDQGVVSTYLDTVHQIWQRYVSAWAHAGVPLFYVHRQWQAAPVSPTWREVRVLYHNDARFRAQLRATTPHRHLPTLPLTPPTCLSILYLAARYMHWPVLSNDVVRWCREGTVPYFNMGRRLPDDTAFLLAPIMYVLSPKLLPAPARVYRGAVVLSHNLRFPMPPLNVHPIATHLAARVGLPACVVPAVHALAALDEWDVLVSPAYAGGVGTYGQLRVRGKHARRALPDPVSQARWACRGGDDGAYIAALCVLAAKCTAGWRQWACLAPGPAASPPYSTHPATSAGGTGACRAGVQPWRAAAAADGSASAVVGDSSWLSRVQSYASWIQRDLVTGDAAGGTNDADGHHAPPAVIGRWATHTVPVHDAAAEQRAASHASFKAACKRGADSEGSATEEADTAVKASYDLVLDALLGESVAAREEEDSEQGHTLPPVPTSSPVEVTVRVYGRPLQAGGNNYRATALWPSGPGKGSVLTLVANACHTISSLSTHLSALDLPPPEHAHATMLPPSAGVAGAPMIPPPPPTPAAVGLEAGSEAGVAGDGTPRPRRKSEGGRPPTSTLPAPDHIQLTPAGSDMKDCEPQLVKLVTLLCRATSVRPKSVFSFLRALEYVVQVYTPMPTSIQTHTPWHQVLPALPHVLEEWGLPSDPLAHASAKAPAAPKSCPRHCGIDVDAVVAAAAMGAGSGDAGDGLGEAAARFSTGTNMGLRRRVATWKGVITSTGFKV